MIDYIREIFLMMVHSLKLLLKNRQTLVVLAVSFLLLLSLLFCMDEVKEEKSKISIGMVNEGQSELVNGVIAGMRQKDMYDILIGEETELVEQIKTGELSAVCVFRKDYDERIFKGKTNKLVTIYEMERGDALLLGDILAGVMMQEICTAKSYQTLLSYAKKAKMETDITPEEYRVYVNEILEKGGSEFSFDISYMTPEGDESEKPSQAIIYEQAIFAVFALMAGLIAIYSALPFRQIRHGRLADRMKTLPVHGSAAYVGSALAGLLLPLGFAMIFLLGISLRSGIDFVQNILLLVCTVVYICGIVCIMLFAAYGIKNPTVYQMGMLAMILIFGVFGLVSLVDGFLVPEGTTAWIPNGWYVQKMTELLHQ